VSDHDDVEPIGPKGRCPGKPGTCEGDESTDFVLYSDGHGYCHAGTCVNKFWSPAALEERGFDLEGLELSAPPLRSPSNKRAKDVDLQNLVERSEPRALPKWKVLAETAAKWDYRVYQNSDGEGIHVAVYRDEHGNPVDAKVRNSGKDGSAKSFFWASDHKEKPLYGIQLLPPAGKKVVVCEGEKDALSMSQLLTAYPVVSVPNGAGPQTKKDLARYVERLSKFDEVVLCFDPDEAGETAAKECARLFDFGKVTIARLPSGLDVTELVQAGRSKEVTGAIFNPEEFRPDGIVAGRDLVEQAMGSVAWGLRYGIDFIDDLQWGWRDGEVVVFGAGTGMGKSDLMYQVAAFMMRPQADGTQGVPCAIFNHEASPTRILKGIAGKHAQKRFTVPDPEGVYWTLDDLRSALTLTTETYAQPYINDAKGVADWAKTKDRIRYLYHAHGVKRFFIDPMAAYAAGMEDERKGIDLLMADSVGLAEELGVGIWWNSHLARPQEGKSHEEGGRVTLKNFRGSGAITIWAALVLGAERNQQADDPEDRAVTTLRALKVREAGENTGQTGKFVWNALNGMWETQECTAFEDSTVGDIAPAQEIPQ
jgi:twinkle protein